MEVALKHSFPRRDCAMTSGGAVGPRAAGEQFPSDDMGSAYAVMNARRARVAGARFLWLADIQEDKKENLYMDRIHYTADFSREIAGRIFAFFQAEKLLCRGIGAASRS